MNLTKRHNEILRAALSYAYSNVDDINDAMSDLHLPVAPFTGEEIADLQNMLGMEGNFDHPQEEADAIVRDMMATECFPCSDSYYHTDGGGTVEHLSKEGLAGRPLCGQKASVGAWVHCPDEKISKREDVPAYICRKCVRIAFPSA